MVVFVVPRQPRDHFIEAALGNDRYAVECLLTVHRNVVSQRLDGLARESLVDAFGFLQTGHVGLAFLQPSEDIVEPLLDRVDVPGRYSHCTLPARPNPITCLCHDTAGDAAAARLSALTTMNLTTMN